MSDDEDHPGEAGAGSLQISGPPKETPREIILIPPRLDADYTAGARFSPPERRERPWASPFALAAAAALAAVVGVGGALIAEHHEQAKLIAAHASETQSLQHTVNSLAERLNAIESTTPRDDLADLRRSVGELKSNLTSTRELNGVLSQLSQRVDKLDHEESAKVDKLGERVDHEATAVTTELSARLDKLEKKAAAPPSPPPPASAPKLGPNVSMEPTGSIERPRPLLRSYIVLDASSDVALVGGRFGEREVREGDVLPGAGRVERIVHKEGGWLVLTSQGVIAQAEFAPPILAPIPY
jgi:hypothetical protein